MNKAYSLVWNEALGGWTVAGETARRRGKRSGGKCAIAVAASLLGLVATGAHALPTGGAIVGGKGDISTSADGKAMSVNQHTDKLITNWQDFSIAGGERVSFHQPTDKSIALNRVIGTNGSQIQGQLDANGRLFVVNPNGVVFGKGAQVNVGGLVATTRNISDADFLNGKYRFTGTSKNAVVNEGTITAAEGGSVALLGAQVSNSGTIQAKLGRVALGAGNTMTVNFDGNGLLNLQVNEGAVNAQVNNGGLLKADGGEVLMTARAAGNLLGAVVNNTGTIEAKGLNSRSGKITLEGGLVKVAGKLDASGQEAAASGGVVTTRGERVEVANDVQVDTRAAGGRTGTWKIEAANAGVDKDSTPARQRGLVIDGGLSGNSSDKGASIQAGALSRALGTTSVELSNTRGVLTVDGAVNWASDNKLTLTSQKSRVDLKQAIRSSGANAGLTVNAAGKIRLSDAVALTGQNARLELNSLYGYSLENEKAVVTLSGEKASFGANGDEYTVIHDLAGLRNVDANLKGRYVLGNAIKGSDRFRSIGGGDSFTGVFDGFGNTISGLTVYNTDSPYVGLFASNAGSIANVKLQGITANGVSPYAYSQWVYVGALAGLNVGTISNVTAKDVRVTGSGAGATVLGGLVGMNLSGKIDRSSVSGRIEGDRSTRMAGGLVGDNATELWPNPNRATISNSSADVDVVVKGTRADNFTAVGGLVGHNTGTIEMSKSSGTVEVDGEGAMVGGLVGLNEFNLSSLGYIYASSSSSTVKTGDNAKAGGLVGVNRGNIEMSSASGAVTAGANSRAGGLVGENEATISRSEASGKVTAGASSRAGGLVGSNEGEVLVSDATGDVVAGDDSQAGGLVGYSGSRSRIILSNARGKVLAGDRSKVGGLVGENYGMIIRSSAHGTVTAGAESQAGGLAGLSEGDVMDSEATGDVIAGANSAAGGLIGASSGNVQSSRAFGNVSAGSGSSAGGLIGINSGYVQASSARGNVTVAGTGNAGGLVGLNRGWRGYVMGSEASGDVSATGEESAVGGLVGRIEDGGVQTSSARGSVKGGDKSYVGGLVGLNNGTISGSSSSGTVSGGNFAKLGGLVGQNLLQVMGSTTSSKIVLTPGYFQTVGALAGTNFGILMGNSATGEAAGMQLVGVGRGQTR
ncbi:two-partner secretion domain-containing protein [Burkholderia catarinensis]|uniref:two-partner secretion domain-containing protein n=1 Tax=Burkholderia catarinensis TaxID=1108140 RepID=UPI001C56B148|nr:GLUG motif-containing protein [Burkholderia catarinensis]KAG8150663.1 filamentous hemagglutinin [Burkholderia catarinensis]